MPAQLTTRCRDTTYPLLNTAISLRQGARSIIAPRERNRAKVTLSHGVSKVLRNPVARRLKDAVGESRASGIVYAMIMKTGCRYARSLP